MCVITPDKQVFIVSDLHLGDGSKKDNFRKYRKRFDCFLDGLDANAQLVLAGDVFEFWQCPHGAVVREYQDLLKRLVDMKALFIVGNHDIDLLGFVDLSLGDRFTGLLRKDLSIERNGRTIFVCHGHEFDEFNDPSRSLFIGRIVSILGGEAEMRLGPEIGGQSTETFLLSLLRGFGTSFLSLYRKFHKTPSESKARMDKYLVALRDFKQKHPEVHTVVSGHTHLSGTYEDWYFNTGCWQDEEAAYAMIGTDGRIELRRPNGEQVKRKLWAD